MNSVAAVMRAIRDAGSPEARKKQAYFGIRNVKSYGLTVPQIRSIARKTGRDHALALALWKTGIHEARHIATLIADPGQLTAPLMNRWLADFNSWDITDGCCSNYFRKSPLAWKMAVSWAGRSGEFEKRAAFSLMACLAVHDKQAADGRFERFLPLIAKHADDDRNFVRKSVNWALRQIGKRNKRLCAKAMATARHLKACRSPSARWVGSDALRELERYRKEGRIKNTGSAS